MATATLKEKVKKAVNGIMTVGQQDDDEVCYYKDEYALKNWEREIMPRIEVGNTALRAMEKFYPVENIEEFFGMIESPFTFYKFKHKIAHEEEMAKFEAMGVELTIAAPKDFDVVQNAAARAFSRFQNYKREYFTIENGHIALTESYYHRRNRACYATAKGPEEIERLEYCQGLITAIEKLEPILLRDNRKYAIEAVKTKRYALPLPYALKIVATSEGAKIIPNPMFIREGFGGSAHLGVYLSTKQEKKLAAREAVPQLGKKLKKIRIIDTDGMPTSEHILCKEEDVNKHMMGRFRMHKNIVLDGYFNEDGAPWGTPLKMRYSNHTSMAERIINSYQG